MTFLGVGAVAGIGMGAALAGGRVGWLPLGPREPFRPWYRASDSHFRQVNVANVTNVTTINRDVTINNFANRRAATIVPTSAMTASRPVGTAFQRVDPAQLAQARPVFGQQPLRPAPTTVGVTPVVARQLGLPPSSPSLRTIAPGPTLRAAPAGVSTGVVAGTVAGRPAVPTLHNPAQPNLPAVAGSARPFTATPALRAPAPGQIGPPAIQREPGFAGQGAGSQVPPLVNRGSGGATPAIVTRELPQLQRAPGAAFQQTIPPAAPQASPTAPSVAGRPPPVVEHGTDNGSAVPRNPCAAIANGGASATAGGRPHPAAAGGCKCPTGAGVPPAAASRRPHPACRRWLQMPRRRRCSTRRRQSSPAPRLRRWSQMPRRRRCSTRRLRS